MTNQTRNRIINELAASIDIPDSAYATADVRYKDIGKWFSRQESACGSFNPHVYPQGSFRLGTVIKPVHADVGYDLDIGCRLRAGISKTTHTQKQLKQLVGSDLEAYRVARQVEERIEEKHRCWRLKYADSIQFHIDTVPSIPETEERRQLILESMVRAGVTDPLSRAVTQHTGAITDNRDPNYDIINPAWRVSNSEGYALWFESRMKLAMQLLETRAIQVRAAKLDDLPTYRWKSPLQRCVQILKCHRDLMYADNPDNKPISVIVTTLAGEAYQAEVEIADALDRILSDMGSKVRTSKPRVPNPVNPAEDFADKWGTPQYRHLNLEENFWKWLKQAQSDFALISNSRSVESLTEMVKAKFGITLNHEGLEERLGFGAAAISTTPKHHNITVTPAKPWSRMH
jgi:hypothetical protein